MNDFGKDFERYLNLYLDGRLSAEERGAFEDYLSHHPEQAREVLAYRALSDTARRDKTPQPAAGYWEGLESRIMARLERLPEKRSWLSRQIEAITAWLTSYHIVFRYVAVAITVVVIALLSYQFFGKTRVTDLAESPELSGQYKIIAPPAYVIKPADEAANVVLAESTEDSLINRLEKAADSMPGRPVIESRAIPSEDTGRTAPAESISFRDLALSAAMAKRASEADREVGEAMGLPPIVPDSLRAGQVRTFGDQIQLQSVENVLPFAEGESVAVDKLKGGSSQEYAGRVHLKGTDTGRIRWGEDEMIEGERPRIDRRDFSQMNPEDFPALPLEQYAFFAESKTKAPTFKKQDSLSIAASVNIPDSTGLMAAIDSLLAAYAAEESPAAKAELLRVLTDRYRLLAMQTGDSTVVGRCQVLLRKAQQVGLFTFEEFEIYIDSLSAVLRRTH